MSHFPSSVIGRLHELKLWQGNYDTLMESSTDFTDALDFDTVEEVVPRDNVPLNPLSSPDDNSNVDWDKKAISPSKPFEQLLEEKLAQDKPVDIQVKPKKPFLKKGSGLVKYKLNSTARLNGKKLPMQKKLSENKMKWKGQSNVQNQFYLKSPCEKDADMNLTPLKMPDLIIKPKATWFKVQDDKPNDVGILNNKEFSNKIIRDFNTPIKNSKVNNFNSHIMDKINDFALKHFFPNRSNRPSSKKPPKHNNSITLPNTHVQSDTEHELQIFEALEGRVDNSSFSSTNSSIIRLLSSTPNKKAVPVIQSPISEEKKFALNNSEDLTINQGLRECGDLQEKLEALNKKSDVLHEFLTNLKKYGSNDTTEWTNNAESAYSRAKSTPPVTPTSFSDEEKWSSNTEFETTCHTPSPSNYSDYENTVKHSTSIKVDMAVNTSFNENSPHIQTEKCSRCEELQRQLDDIAKDIPDIQAEKARVCDFAKDIEKKRDELNKEMETLRAQYEFELHNLNEQLQNEKKKVLKEKATFDAFVKNSQNRTNKKEREEICNLQKELIDMKALMQLKEVKNGSALARLRNQIKQLEKENDELKTKLENLRKENAKLNAKQNIRRPNEVKMLHEINRNLTKLTEETFKKHLHNSEKSTIPSQHVKETLSVRTLSNEDHVKHSKISIKSDNNKNPFPKGTKDNNKQAIINFTNLSLERQYENVFGQFVCPLTENTTLNDSKRDKTETVFPDGSKEIKYSNGNIKTISPDGNIIIVKYYNGDIKESYLSEGTLRYHYAENETWHTQVSDGSELLEYPTGQKEKIYKDGKKEINCTDGTFIVQMPDGTEEILYPDGSKIVKNQIGEKILLLPNGQKEIHTKEHKRREYPDGTVKVLYPDGSQETRYSSGRVRIKGANGELIKDSYSSNM